MTKVTKVDRIAIKILSESCDIIIDVKYIPRLSSELAHLRCSFILFFWINSTLLFS